MNRVDFTPEWYLRARLEAAARHRSLVWCAGLAAAMTLVAGAGAAHVRWTRVQIVELQTITRQRQPVVDRLERLRQRLAQDERDELLCEDLTGSVGTYRLLAEVSRLLPDSTALTRLSFQQPRRARPKADPAAGASEPSDQDTGSATHNAGSEGASGVDDELLREAGRPDAGVLVLEGTATSPGDVGRLVERLSESRACANVRLACSRPGGRGDSDAVLFRVTGDVPLFE